MCGRFAITLPNDAMARAFAARPANDLPPAPRFNVCPTQPVASVISRDGMRDITPMRWGFLPRWYRHETDGPLLINARAETIARRPAFAQAARERRCLIPASGFFEWTKDSQGNRLPWYIAPREGGMLAFAGVWQVWEHAGARQVTCAIVTCAANAAIARIHHRMPVILDQDDWPLWLGEAGHGAARLMCAARQDALVWHRVAPAVNSNRAEGPKLIAPLTG
ncbi:MAG: SOS response-associated peptidase [Roseinatronobacter sp.]